MISDSWKISGQECYSLMGFNEVMNNSPTLLKKRKQMLLPLLKPLSNEFNTMRQSLLLEGLLQNAGITISNAKPGY